MSLRVSCYGVWEDSSGRTWMGYSESDLVIKSDQMAQPSIQLSTFRTNLKSTDGASIISTSRILRGCLNCASSKG